MRGTKARRGPAGWLAALWCALVLALCGPAVQAQSPVPSSEDVTTAARYWLDVQGGAGLPEARQALARGGRPLDPRTSHALDHGALWLQVQPGPLDARQRWFLVVDFNALDLAELHDTVDGQPRVRQAGDRLPLSRWSWPDRQPVFELQPAAAGSPVWLRLANRPVPISPRLLVMNEAELQRQRTTALLLIGGYLGLGVLVLALGVTSARLYRDNAFSLYALYVGTMLGLQLAYTGLGGLLLWPESPAWNNLAPAVFTALSCAASVWFVREVASVRRYSRRLNRALFYWGVAGLVIPPVYAAWQNQAVLWLLHGYMGLSLVLAVALLAWAWRQGEKYALWMLAGFLPVIVTLPFPALRNLGLMPAGFVTQFSLLVGSAVEIPLLLYLMHRRARELTENRARLRALDSTDPLTGLVAEQILDFRLRDALLRADRYGHRAGVLMVELANHADLVREGGARTAERALVRAASHLSRAVREIDTVARVGPTRFALLVEGPQTAHQLGAVATRVVARGLMPDALGGRMQPALQYRVVTLLAPDIGAEWGADAALCLACLSVALDAQGQDGQRMIRHLST